MCKFLRSFPAPLVLATFVLLWHTCGAGVNTLGLGRRNGLDNQSGDWSGVLPQPFTPRVLQSLVADNLTELCLVDKFYGIAQSCKPQNTDAVRAAVVVLLYNCAFDTNATRALNAPTFVLLIDAAQSMQDFANSTGLVITTPLVDLTIYIYWASAALAAPNSVVTVPGLPVGGAGDRPPDVFTFLSRHLGQGYEGSALMDLSQIVLDDAQLDWTDVLLSVRQEMVQLGGKLLGTIFTSYSNMLVYRTDLFTRYGLTVPTTWRQLLALGQLMNGTDTSGSGTTVGPPADGSPGNLLGFCMSWNCVQPPFWMAYIMGTMMQTQGQSQGWLLDLVTLESNLAGNVALIETLNILQSLYKLMLNGSGVVDDGGCGSFWIQPAFLAGNCLMGFDVPRTFKVVSSKGSAYANTLRGNIGFAPAPGSIKVLDRSTNQLVYCNKTLCPYATETTPDENGVMRTVNRAPPLEALMLGVNEGLEDDVKFMAYNLMSYATSSPRLSPLLYDSSSVVFPFRNAMFAPAPWVAAGYDPSDTASFLPAVYTSLNHPNLLISFRWITAPTFYDMFLETIANYTDPTSNQTAYDISVIAEQRIRAAVAASGPFEIFRAEYWRAINYSPAPPPPPLLLTPPLSQSSSKARTLDLSLAVALPGAALLAGFLVAAYLAWRYLLPKYRYLLMAPGIGPTTALVVTDIQSSTDLWEALPQDVMQATMRVHHTCIRRVAAKYHGYEGHTEGDSFILAFHNPTDALLFALAAQKALMEEEWPQELLAHDICKPVWVAAHGRSDLAVRPSSRAAHSLTGSNSDVSQLRQFSSARSSLLRLNGARKGHSSTHDAVEKGQRPSVSPVVSAVSMGRLVSSGSFLAGSRMDGGTVLLAAWQDHFHLCPDSDARKHLVFRGLRVRVGIHCGMGDGEVEFDKRFGRWRYQGHALTQAKAIGDVGPGGMITLCSDAVEKLGQTLIDPNIVLLHMGEHELQYGADVIHAGVYQALSRDLVGRQIAFSPLSLRTSRQYSLGVWDAPWGNGTLAIIKVVGTDLLLRWNHEEAVASLAVFQELAEDELSLRRGYLVTSSDGLMIASFSESYDAVAWVMRVQEALLNHPWSDELLCQELCEPFFGLQCESAADATEEDQYKMVAIFRGLRTKAGLFDGPIKGYVNQDTGTVTYNPACMERLTTLGDKALTGQVLATSKVHDAFKLAIDLNGVFDDKLLGVEEARMWRWDEVVTAAKWSAEVVYAIRAPLRRSPCESDERARHPEHEEVPLVRIDMH